MCDGPTSFTITRRRAYCEAVPVSPEALLRKTVDDGESGSFARFLAVTVKDAQVASEIVDGANLEGLSVDQRTAALTALVWSDPI